MRRRVAPRAGWSSATPPSTPGTPGWRLAPRCGRGGGRGSAEASGARGGLSRHAAPAARHAPQRSHRGRGAPLRGRSRGAGSREPSPPGAMVAWRRRRWRDRGRGDCGVADSRVVTVLAAATSIGLGFLIGAFGTLVGAGGRFLLVPLLALCYGV